MRTNKRLFTIIVAMVLASSGFGVAAHAEETNWADGYAVASLAELEGISREEAARRLDNQGQQAELAQRLAEQLGDRAAGGYLDRRTGNLVVNVLDERAAAEVRSAGATPRTVRYSLAELESVSSQLDRDGTAGRAGFVVSMGVDTEANAVVVTIPAAAEREAARFLDEVRSFGDRTRVEFTRDPGPAFGAFNVYAGGQAFTTAGGSCTAGFAAKDAANYRYMVTAQHCVAGNNFNVNMFGQFFGQRWWQSQAYDTASVLNWYPANMNQLPRVWHWNNGYVVVKGWLTSFTNWYVCKSGMTTHWTCGYVTATGQKVWVAAIANYVWNLTAANMCMAPGDSGGPVVLKSGVNWYATGVMSLYQFAPPCTVNSKSWYVPIGTALAQTGLTLVTG
jgi:streptogrisin C